MARNLIAAYLALTLCLTGCAATRPPVADTPIVESAEPSPYVSHEWIKEETWWETRTSLPSTSTVALNAVEAAEVVLTVPILIGLVCLFFIAPRPSG